jgi:hypothetical protein
MAGDIDRNCGGDQQLVIRYSAPRRRFDGLFGAAVCGVLTAAGLLPLWAAMPDPRGAWSECLPVTVWLLTVGLGSTLLCGLATARLLAQSWREIRGDWWLRLSRDGFEVNDRVFTPRRYQWRDIDTFLVTEGETEEGTLVRHVGFRYKPNYHGPLATRLISGAAVDGHWDRPDDAAADLMNQWLARHQASVTQSTEPATSVTAAGIENGCGKTGLELGDAGRPTLPAGLRPGPKPVPRAETLYASTPKITPKLNWPTGLPKFVL